MTTTPTGEKTAGPPQDIGRRAWLLSGRVQGVGFRWWTSRTAEELGLRGTVENRPDGRVEIHAEGRPAALRDLERRLEDGPAAARVDAVESIEPSRELPSDFRITG